MHTEAEKYLRKRDPILASLIKKHGPCTIVPSTNYFGSLCSAIISQQLSVKVAATIEKRFLMLFDKSKPKAEETLALNIAELRSVGLSEQKAKYMHSLAEHFAEARIKPRSFRSMSDEQIIEALCAVHGVGRWTAEMFLMFTLARPDVFSFGDYGLRTAMGKLYSLETKTQILEKAQEWAPYRSVASWYLWRSLENT